MCVQPQRLLLTDRILAWPRHLLRVASSCAGGAESEMAGSGSRGRLLGPILCLAGAALVCASLSLPFAMSSRQTLTVAAHSPSSHQPVQADLQAVPVEEQKTYNLETQRGAEASILTEFTGDAASIAERMVGARICDLPEFRPDVPPLNLTIYVFAWRRLASLRRTVRSLQRAEYCGRQLPLHVMVDGGALPEVKKFVASIAWVHGDKKVVSYDEQGLSLGIRGMWIRSAAAVGSTSHILPLEDDIEVSPLYYWWLTYAANTYGPLGDPALMKARGLVGISLYTPRLNEIHYPQAKWLPSGMTRSPVFALQVPCSWGALFVGSVWNEFLQFYARRVKPPFFNFSQEKAQRGVGKDREPLGDPHLYIPFARSNVWPRSWKRFMIDFMYGRGYVMLYPNLNNQRAFSTTYMERGGHSGKDGKVEEMQASELRNEVDPLKTVPLLTRADVNLLAQQMATIPAYDYLPVFDIYHQPSNRKALVSHGFAFTEGVRWWGTFLSQVGSPDIAAGYAALAAEWSGVGWGVSPSGEGRQLSTSSGGCAISELLGMPPDSRVEEDRRAPAGVPKVSLQGAGARAGVGAGAVEGLGPAARVGGDGSGGFIVFQPPGGLGEWFISLKNAIGIAAALKRTLVLPHLMWGGGWDAQCATRACLTWSHCDNCCLEWWRWKTSSSGAAWSRTSCPLG